MRSVSVQREKVRTKRTFGKLRVSACLLQYYVDRQIRCSYSVVTNNRCSLEPDNTTEYSITIL
jgi:hypothetical protein